MSADLSNLKRRYQTLISPDENTEKRAAAEELNRNVLSTPRKQRQNRDDIFDTPQLKSPRKWVTPCIFHGY